jgi:hypothetical protein
MNSGECTIFYGFAGNGAPFGSRDSSPTIGKGASHIKFKMANSSPLAAFELLTRIEADMQLGQAHYHTVVLHWSGLRTITDSMELWKSRRFFMARCLHLYGS